MDVSRGASNFSSSYHRQSLLVSFPPIPSSSGPVFAGKQLSFKHPSVPPNLPRVPSMSRPTVHRKRVNPMAGLAKAHLQTVPQQDGDFLKNHAEFPRIPIPLTDMSKIAGSKDSVLSSDRSNKRGARLTKRYSKKELFFDVPPVEEAVDHSSADEKNERPNSGLSDMMALATRSKSQIDTIRRPSMVYQYEIEVCAGTI